MTVCFSRAIEAQNLRTPALLDQTGLSSAGIKQKHLLTWVKTQDLQTEGCMSKLRHPDEHPVNRKDSLMFTLHPAIVLVQLMWKTQLPP